MLQTTFFYVGSIDTSMHSSGTQSKFNDTNFTSELIYISLGSWLGTSIIFLEMVEGLGSLAPAISHFVEVPLQGFTSLNL